MDEQMIADCPFCEGPVHRKVEHGVEGCFHIGMPHCPVLSNRMMTLEQWNPRAAHSVIAGKVAELEGALKDARFCIGALQAQLIGFAQPAVNVEFVVGKIDAALAPYLERR